MTTQLTRNYWIDVFEGWIEARDMPGPQNDEAMQVIAELKSAEARVAELEAERDGLKRKLEQAQSLKLFVWEDVLADYSSGVMFALAKDVDTARLMLRDKCNFLPDYEVNSEPVIHTEPYAVVVWGGS